MTLYTYILIAVVIGITVCLIIARADHTIVKAERAGDPPGMPIGGTYKGWDIIKPSGYWWYAVHEERGEALGPFALSRGALRAVDEVEGKR